MSNIFIELKKTCLGVLERGESDKDNETGLKERGGIEMSTTVLSITRCTLSSLKILTGRQWTNATFAMARTQTFLTLFRGSHAIRPTFVAGGTFVDAPLVASDEDTSRYKS